MRFLEESADIPDELIEAARDGKVVFLCGAGVSLRVGLPSFEALTQQVYDYLGESANDEPAERRAIERKEFDRALRSLEKRTHRPGTESRVRIAVTKLLAPPAQDLPDHNALLQLSKDAQGRPKLLTTNFDTLFERAAAAAGMRVPSHAGKSIPKLAGNATTGFCICTAGSRTHHFRLIPRISSLRARISETPICVTAGRRSILKIA